jgi:hypothetical protein
MQYDIYQVETSIVKCGDLFIPRHFTLKVSTAGYDRVQHGNTKMRGRSMEETLFTRTLLIVLDMTDR